MFKLSLDCCPQPYRAEEGRHPQQSCLCPGHSCPWMLPWAVTGLLLLSKCVWGQADLGCGPPEATLGEDQGPREESGSSHGPSLKSQGGRRKRPAGNADSGCERPQGSQACILTEVGSQVSALRSCPWDRASHVTEEHIRGTPSIALTSVLLEEDANLRIPSSQQELCGDPAPESTATSDTDSPSGAF